MKGFFYWFKDSSKMKRWIMLILVGVVFTSFGMANLINATEAITLKLAAKAVIYFVIGFTCVVLGLIFINKRTMELFIEATDDRIEKGKKVNVNSLIFNKKIYETGPKIVVIGGGSGLNTLLAGLKKYTSNITAIVTVSDYGEAQAENKFSEFEDIKDAIGALSLAEENKINELLNYKFENGVQFSDLYFKAMCDISKSSAEAVKNGNDIFKIYGKVLPVTEEKIKICAELENGYVVEEKSKISQIVYDKLTRISRIYINPSNCKPTKGVIEEINSADCIIIGPGSLYTNVIPNLLVNGVTRAIKESKAIKLYVCNIMTEPGQTDNFSVSDHINTIVDHCGDSMIDYCLYDTGEVIPEYIKKYNRDGQELVEQDIQKVKDKKIKFIKENLSTISGDCIRHDASIIADTAIKLICDDLKYQDKQNEPEYLMMNTKLREDKRINKEKKKNLKKNKKPKERKEKGKKSKFATKYSDRIESIKNTDKQIAKKKEYIEKEKAKIRKEKKAKVKDIKKENEKINNKAIKKGTEKINNKEYKKEIVVNEHNFIKKENKLRKGEKENATNKDDFSKNNKEENIKEKRNIEINHETLRPKDYEQIRKEMLERFNNSGFKN